MVKPNKVPFIILLSIALAFIAATFIFLFVPEPTPVKMTQKFSITETEDGFALYGKIRNETDEELTLWEYGYMSLNVTTLIKDDLNGSEREYEFKIFNEKTVIQPKTEYEFFEEININKGYTPVKIISVRAKVANSSGFALYGNVVNDGMFSVIALFTGIFGVVFLIIACVAYSTEKKNAKVTNNIIKQIKETLGEGVLVTGQFGNKAENRAATAKTTASVFGAVVSATVFGLGRYTVYGKSSKTDFILTENSVYIYFDRKFNNITNAVKSALTNPVITQKKKKICVTGNQKNIFFAVKLSKDPDKNSEILHDLQSIFYVDKTEKQ